MTGGPAFRFWPRCIRFPPSKNMLYTKGKEQGRQPMTMAPPGSSRPSLTYTDQTSEALLPAITPCLNFGFRPKLGAARSIFDEDFKALSVIEDYAAAIF
jgi:hypothetical protein